MKRHILLTAVSTSLLAANAFAGTMGPVAQPDRSWVAAISAGPVWANAGETQTFYLASEIEKTYAARKSSNVLAAGELFLGLQKALAHELEGQLGLAVATTGNAKLQGEVWDDADPQFNNYVYQYKVRNTRVAVKGKLLLDKGYWLMPWLSASLGVGFNHTSGYTNTPTIFEALPNSNFGNNNTTAFTYTVGAGVQKALNTHWQVGAGYEFADWGKNQLARASGQTLNSGLAMNHLYTNGLMFNITYIA